MIYFSEFSCWKETLAGDVNKHVLELTLNFIHQSGRYG